LSINNPFRKIHLLPGILAFFLSFSLSLTIYLLFIQTPLLSKREFLAVVLLFLVLIFPVYLSIDRFLLAQFQEFSPRGKTFLVLSSILFGFIIILTTNYPALYFASPDHTLKIQVPETSGENASARSVSVIWITTGFGDVSFSQLQKVGGWERSDSGIIHTGPQAASLFWEGKAGDEVKVELKKTSYSNPILVISDGQETSIDLKGNGDATQTITQTFNSYSPGSLLAVFIVGLSAAFLFLIITIFLLSWELKSKPLSSRGKYSWLFYTLPMVAVWGISLLTFFPGMMSTDSNDQWGQILSGHFNDAHPVFHTLSMWLVTRLWLSPAAVVIAQIIFLSLTVAWGIRLLDEHGFPPWASWLLVAIFALAPLNANMVIVQWKDIPYSTSLFLFSLMALKIVLTNGAWLEKRLTWIWLGVVCLCVTSFRHNGLPIPLATLLLLLVFYRKWWKPLLGAFVLMTVLYAVIHGPLYSALRVGQRPLGFIQDVMLHHISAHINTGQPLSLSEQALADTILPREMWKYDSCTTLSIMFTPGYSKLTTAAQGPAIQKLFIDLALKEPLVELRHLGTVSSIVWRSPGFCRANTLIPINPTTWISTLPTKYIPENSLLPFIQKPSAEFFISLRTNPDLTLLIAPAVYLILGIYATTVFSIRIRNWKGLLFIFPVGLQAVILGLINQSDNFRYHYGAYLIGLFGIGLLIFSLGQIIPERQDKKV
jgi:hypothetical protein